MARLGVQEEEKLLEFKYVGGLSLDIQQQMSFTTVRMISNAFHYTSKIEARKNEKQIL